MCDTLLEDCSICLEHIINDDLKQKTVCQHTFHASCLSRWTQANNSCPLCRNKLSTYPLQLPPTASAGETDVAYVPLPFWFTRDEHLIIPEVAYNHSMRTVININFAELSDLELADLILEEDENQPSLYSFALEPEEYQPSGSSHVSRIDDTRLFMSGGVVGALPLYLTSQFNLFPESNEPSGSVNRERVAY
jgi:hypothetical protein